MDPLLLANPQLSSLINLSNTYPPYHSKCPFPLSSSFMLPFSHWSFFSFYNSSSSSSSLCYRIRIESLSSLFTITMIKTLSPYPNPAKTAEIMSRYRPIAPKPDTSSGNSSITDGSSTSSSNSLSQKIKQSPYLRNLWPQLQARPTRTRKRGRASLALPSSLKRQKTQILGFCPPSCHLTSLASSKNLSLQGFAPPPPSLSLPQPPLPKTPITLPLLPGAITTIPPNTNPGEEVIIDLNLTSTTTNAAEIPQERDLLQQLQKPASFSSLNSNNNVVNVIVPQPIRPIGSLISVGCINEDSTLLPSVVETTKRSPEELEEEVESETLPAVISDSNNRVRMANSAYKEMVGQPECTWLSGIGNGDGDGRVLCKRIGGEVRLNLCDGSKSIPVSSKGFSCWVKIEWESEEKKKSSVNAFCDVIKLCCESRDYLFSWRFHTRDCREASQSSCNAIGT